MGHTVCLWGLLQYGSYSLFVGPITVGVSCESGKNINYEAEVDSLESGW